jgi:hypothetical protein
LTSSPTFRIRVVGGDQLAEEAAHWPNFMTTPNIMTTRPLFLKEMLEEVNKYTTSTKSLDRDPAAPHQQERVAS